MPENFEERLRESGLPVVEADDSGKASFSRTLTMDELAVMSDIVDPPTSNEVSDRIDAKTGKAINSILHEYSGVEEQLGILRYQITRMLNGDMTASEDFSRLNGIAIAEIEKAKAVKDAQSN